MSAQPSVDLVFVAEFGTQGSKLGQFVTPRAIATNDRDQIIVADSGNDRIQICDIGGQCSAFGTRGERHGQFINPHGVAVDSQARILTVETYTQRVQIFRGDGMFLA
ncbi:MAG: hypothetical protein IIB74_03590, partial [Proteobacteria bacterium]|nr:hypothetical protein [Pseudomonadota bacterium]